MLLPRIMPVSKSVFVVNINFVRHPTKPSAFEHLDRRTLHIRKDSHTSVKITFCTSMFEFKIQSLNSLSAVCDHPWELAIDLQLTFQFHSPVRRTLWGNINLVSLQLYALKLDSKTPFLILTVPKLCCGQFPTLTEFSNFPLLLLNRSNVGEIFSDLAEIL